MPSLGELSNENPRSLSQLPAVATSRCRGAIEKQYLITALVLLAFAQSPAAETSVRTASASRANAFAVSGFTQLEVGKPAPDFELPLLKEETAPNGKKLNRITDEKVRLSALRGQKVVCLFMSSYT